MNKTFDDTDYNGIVVKIEDDENENPKIEHEIKNIPAEQIFEKKPSGPLKTQQSVENIEAIEANKIYIPTEMSQGQNKENQNNSHPILTRSSCESSKYDTTDALKLKDDVNILLRFLESNQNFSQRYSLDLVKIFRKLSVIIFKKVSNTLNQNENFLKFFKEVTITYQKFSTNLIKANSMIIGSIKQDQILSDNMNTVIEKTQESIANNFSNFSDILQNSIIASGPFSRIKEFYNRLNVITKDITGGLSVIDKKREKKNNSYNTKYKSMFELYKLSSENGNNDLIIELFKKYDFLLIHFEIEHNVNKLFDVTQGFLGHFKAQINNLKILILDYVNLVKETLVIYVNETKKIFTGSLAFNFENVQKFYEGITKESLESNFAILNILREPEIIKEFNDLLKDFRNNVITNDKYLTGCKDLLENEENFYIEKYRSIDDLIDFFLKINPVKMEKSEIDLIEYQSIIRRDPGFLKSWKNCIMVISKQNNLFIFDDKISRQFIYSFCLKKIKYKHKDDKKHPFRFEIIESKKGMFFTTNDTLVLDAQNKEKFEELAKKLGLLFQYNSEERLSKIETEDKEQVIDNKEIKYDNLSLKMRKSN